MGSVGCSPCHHEQDFSQDFEPPRMVKVSSVRLGPNALDSHVQACKALEVALELYAAGLCNEAIAALDGAEKLLSLDLAN